MKSREVSLELQSRPLCLGYVVRNTTDLRDAVHLYTHSWGGIGSFIFPVPTTMDEADDLKRALHAAEVDHLFIPEHALNAELQHVLDEVALLWQVISSEEIRGHTSWLRPLMIQEGYLPDLPHILEYVYPNNLEASDLHVLELQGPFALALALSYGDPAEQYKRYLNRYFAASLWQAPQTVEDLIKFNLMAAKWSSPISTTGVRTQRRMDVTRSTMDVRMVNLFLGNDDDTHVAASFWNFRRGRPGNKLFLPKNEFCQQPEQYLPLLLDAVPALHALSIRIATNREEAQHLHERLQNIFNMLGKAIRIAVIYDQFGFEIDRTRIFTGTPYTSTHLINTDQSVRFRLIDPPALANMHAKFGYDATVTFDTGKQLELPSTKASAMILSNSLERMEASEANEQGVDRAWLRPEVTRATAGGVTSTATTGEERRFYLHEANVLITQHLKHAQLELRPNKYTRYAQGFVKRLGGMDEALDVIRSEGVHLLTALRTHRAEQAGLNLEQINAFLQKQRAVANPQEVTRVQLPRLLATGFVRRGYSLACPQCDLNDWYALSEIHELVECHGCAEVFPLPLRKLEFTYKANELAARFVETGGQAVLMTADICSRVRSSGAIHFGGDLTRSGEDNRFAEVDLLWLTHDVFAVAECKSYREINDKGLQEIQASLYKTVYDVATPLNAQVVLLGVVTTVAHPDLHAMVADTALKAKDHGIGVHLILNGSLYLRGSSAHTPLPNVTLNSLTVIPSAVHNIHWVGEYPNNYGLGSSKDALDEVVLHGWERELLAR